MPGSNKWLDRISLGQQRPGNYQPIPQQVPGTHSEGSPQPQGNKKVWKGQVSQQTLRSRQADLHFIDAEMRLFKLEESKLRTG